MRTSDSNRRALSVAPFRFLRAAVLLALLLAGAESCSSDESNKPPTTTQGGASGEGGDAGEANAAGAGAVPGHPSVGGSGSGHGGTRQIGEGGAAIAGESGSPGLNPQGGVPNTGMGGLAEGGVAGRAGSGGSSAGGANGGMSGAGGVAGAGGSGGNAAGGSGGNAAGGSAGMSGCGPKQAFNQTAQKCVNCTINCGEDGEIGLYPLTTGNSQCVCETKPGFFYDVGASIGAYPCDADGDGWVRDSARSYIESKDATLKENARCTLRLVSDVVLENEDSDAYSLYFTQALDVTDDPEASGGLLPLYESVRNDDVVKLASEGVAVPAYGGRTLSVAELNGFTKACVSAQADHNDNGVRDIEEWARLPGGQVAIPQNFAGRASYLELYTRFSYFVELDMGAFEQASVDSAARTATGTYHIRERQRADGAGDNFGPKGYAASPGYWRECRRRRDASYSNDFDPVTQDFASLSGPDLVPSSWGGMLHHSQFKCVEVALPQDVDPRRLNRLTSQSLQKTWNVNQCQLQGTAPADSQDAVNPAQPVVACSGASALDVAVGDVRWAEAGFAPQDPSSYSYSRGCVDECAEGMVTPPLCNVCVAGDYGEALISLADQRAACCAGCTGTCKPGLCSGTCDGKGHCGTCFPKDTRCKDADTSQTCSQNGDWASDQVCAFDCVAGSGTCGCSRDLPRNAAKECGSASAVPDLTSGNAGFEVTGRIPKPGDSHWYHVSIPPGTRTSQGFWIELDPVRSGASFRLEIAKFCGGQPYACDLSNDSGLAKDATRWEFNDSCKDPRGCNGTNPAVPTPPNEANIRVYRTDSAVSCEPYTLVFRRP